MRHVLLLLCGMLCSLWAAGQSRPDIMVTGLRAAETRVTSGSSVNVSFNYTYSGSEYATVGIYLSEDATFSAADKNFLLIDNIGLSTTTQLQAISRDLTLSSPALTTVTRYILVVANPHLSLLESDFNNNVASLQVEIDPAPIRQDVYFDAATLDSNTGLTVNAGSSVAVNTMLVNPDSYDPWVETQVAYYLSADSLTDVDDLHLYTQTTQASNAQTLNLEIPAATDTGNWYLILKADPLNQLYESDEANNRAIISLRVNPRPQTDLVVNSISAANADVLITNSSYTNTINVSNIGGAIPTYVYFGLYLSADDVFSSDDYLLQDNMHYSYEIGTDDLQYSFTIPNYWPQDSAYLIAVADSHLEVIEPNERNNILVRKVYIDSPQPDLLFSSYLLSQSTVSVGYEANLQYQLENKGRAASSYLSVYSYLSSDTIIDGSDYLLDENLEIVGIDAATTSSVISRQIMIPSHLDSGNYYLLSQIDPLLAINEEDELNNDTLVSIRLVKSDLTVIDSLLSRSIVAPEDTLTVFYRIENLAENARAPQSAAGYYLSRDTHLDAGDMNFGVYTQIATLEAAAISGSRYKHQLRLPPNTEAGSWYILVQADANQEVNELKEDNNVVALAVEVGLPDLVVKSPVVSPSQVPAGGTTQVRYEVQNQQSTIYSPVGNIYFYLSEDAAFDTTDTYVYHYNFAAFNQEQTIQLQLPSIEAGDYQLLFFVDADSAILESVETNNIVAHPVTVTNPDLLPKNISVSQTTLGIGERAEVSYHVSNQGAANAPASFARIFLHNGQREEEISLGEKYISAIVASGNSTTATNQIYIPTNVAEGIYYLVVEVDHYQGIIESNEINNRDSLEITITNPDLVLENPIVSPSSVSVGFAVRVDVTVKNLSLVDAPSSALYYYLSVDQSLDENDHWLYNRQYTGTIVGEGDSTYVVEDISIPSFLPEGDYYVLVKADGENQVAEANENNNLIAIPIKLRVPDLAVATLTTDKATVGTGEVLTVEVRAKNNSDLAKAIPSRLGMYLSADNNLSEDDALIGTALVPELQISSTSNLISTETTIPLTMEAGTYYILALADYMEQVNESDETNNLSSYQITITNPDLQLKNAVVSKSVLELNETFTISVALENTGQSNAAATSVAYYLSPTDTLGEVFVMANTINGPSLTAGAETTLPNVGIRIPAYTAGGTWYVLVKADSEDIISEEDEENNWIAVPVEVRVPDYEISNFAVASSEIQAGTPFDATFNLRNNANVKAPASTIGLYLSKEPVLDLEDEQNVWLGSVDAALLEAAATSPKLTASMLMPLEVDTGTWYLFARADNINAYAEISEENNTSAPLELQVIGVDIAVADAVVFPDIIENRGAFGDIQVLAEIENLSPVFLYGEDIYGEGTLNAGFYFSSDEVLDESDELLAQEYISLEPHDTISLNMSLRVPLGLENGTYYVLVVADADSLFAESNEVNNLFSVPVTLVPDLLADLVAVDGISLPDVLVPERGFEFSVSYKNAGFKQANGFVLKPYLSVDEVIDGEDISLTTTNEEINADNWDNNGVNTHSFSAQLPAGLEAGIYHLLTLVDGEDSVEELSETNNLQVDTITVRNPYPVDLAVMYVATLPEVVYPGDVLASSSQVENLGTGLSSSTRLGYYLSVDTLLDGNDLLLHAQTVDALNPYSEVLSRPEITMPLTVVAGDYHLLVKIDDQEVQPESDELNNLLHLPVHVGTQLESDLRIVALSTSHEGNEHPNQPFYIYGSLQNIGRGPAADYRLNFYLSKVPALNQESYLLHSELFTDTLRRQSSFYFAMDNVVIPREMPTGNYYLIAMADHDNTLPEAIETNNSFILPLQVGSPLIPDLKPAFYSGGIVAYVDELAQQQFQTTVQIENLGALGGVTANMSLFLSFDDSFDASRDILLQELQSHSVYPDYPVYTSFSFQLPENLSEGTYHLFAVADKNNELYELNEENNVTGMSFVVNPPAKPDVSISYLYLYQQQVPRNGSVSLAYKVSNLSRRSVEDYTVGFYVSTDGTLSDEDVLVEELSGVALTAYQTSGYLYADVYIPESLAEGHYHLFVKADAANALDESDEMNNFTAWEIEITSLALPDLQVQNVSLSSANVHANSQVHVNYLLMNQDGGTARDFNLKYLLSLDQSVSANDIELSTRTIETLRGDQYWNMAEDLVVPATVSPGSYHLLVIADANAQVNESDEANNQATTPLQVLEAVKPDVQISFSASSSVQAGEQVSIHSQVSNQGSGVAEAGLVHIHLSQDAQLDDEDEYLGELAYATLSGGASNISDIDLLIPSTQAPGSYYLIAEADVTNTSDETIETNNTATQAITIAAPVYPDMVVSLSAVSPEEVNAGLYTSINYVVENEGEGAMPEAALTFYLSADNILGSTDITLGSETVGLLNSGQSNEGSVQMLIPSNTSPGNYFVLAKIDAANTIEEGDETNNVSNAFGLRVLERLLPDLNPADLSLAKDEINAGLSTSVSFTVRNLGEAPVQDSEVAVYLSANTSIDGNDVLVGSATITGINAQQNKLSVLTAAIPENTAVGNYYLITVVDHDNAYAESNENNNTLAAAVSILEPLRPDLEVIAISGSASVIAGQQASLSFTIGNTGEILSASSKVRVVLSTDAVISSTDAVLTTLNINALEVGATQDFALGFTMPVSTVPGNYHFIVMADVDGQISEMDESNNQDAVAVLIEEPLPSNLQLSELTLGMAEVGFGEEVTVEVTIVNASANPAAASVVGFYLSTDQGLSAEDVLLGQLEVGEFAANQEQTASGTFRVPANTTEGGYFMLAVADAEGVVNESTETDNLSYRSFTVVTGIEEELLAGLKIYPNPTQDVVHLNNTSQHKLQVYLLNSLGQVIQQTLSEPQAEVSLNLEALQPGTYLIRLENAEGAATLRLIKL